MKVWLYLFNNFKVSNCTCNLDEATNTFIIEKFKQIDNSKRLVFTVDSAFSPLQAGQYLVEVSTYDNVAKSLIDFG